MSVKHIFLLLLLFPTAVFTQTSVTGRVSDKTTGKPIEHVSVTLLRSGDSSAVAGTSTDRNGKFLISAVASGNYFCRFSLIGYETKRSAPFAIDAGHRDANLGSIPLAETAVNLEEMLITGEKSTLNTSIDRKVYNVEKDVQSSAGSASELLQNIPSVEVDIEGNVSLRGSSDVLILINGKNSPLMGKNRAEVLQSMPASSIERIEVISNPTARYKPDGASGIINIVLKKNTASGWNGSVSGNAGNQDRYNGNVSFNARPGDYNFFATYALRRDSRNRITSDDRTQGDIPSSPTAYREDLHSYARPLSHMLTLGMEAEPDRANSFGLSGKLFSNVFDRTEFSTRVTRDASGTATGDYDRNRLDHEFENEYGAAGFYQHAFEGEDHKLRVELDASHAPEQEDNRYTNVYRLPASAPTYDNTLIRQTETRYQAQADYSNPLAEGSLLEAGYAADISRGDYDFSGEYFDPIPQLFVRDSTKTNRFIADIAVHALYATWERSFGAFGLKAGLRVEQAYVTSRLPARDSLIANDYGALYPTLHVSSGLSETAQLQFSYSRRTHRPDGDDLNPFPEYRDPRNLRAGNPKLLPEYVHSLELGCKLQNSFFSLVSSIYYRSTFNRFTTVTRALNDTLLLTTEENLSSDRSAGAEAILSADLGGFFSGHMTANVFQSRIDASNLGFGTRKSIVTWSGAVTCNFRLTASSMLQATGIYNSARLTPQGEYSPSAVANVGARQDLFDRKLTITFTVADLFRTLKRQLTLDTPALKQTVVNTRDSRIMYLGITWRFGTRAREEKEDGLKYDDGL